MPALHAPRLTLAIASTLVLALGCSSNSGGVAPGEAPPVEAAAAAPTVVGDLLATADDSSGTVEGALGVWTLTLEGLYSGNLTADLTPQRSATETDTVSFLPGDSFLAGEGRGLSLNAVYDDGDSITINYVLYHPYPAPSDLDAPSHYITNRADLGFAPRLMVLADLPSAADPLDHTYFAGDDAVVARTDLLRNAHGYASPQGMVNLPPGYRATIFPYQLPLDESYSFEGNRATWTGFPILNGGLGVGNYDASMGGWQRFNMEGFIDQNNGWSGFDVLHQGQLCYNFLQFEKAALTGDSVSLDLVLLGKYIQPKVGETKPEKIAHRLPPVDFDPDQFVYRMPHGALDVSEVDFLWSTPTITAGQVDTATTLEFWIRDWDFRAPVTTAADLSEDPFPGSIPASEIFGIEVWANIPAVNGSGVAVLGLFDDDSSAGGDIESDSGAARDLLYFRGDVQNFAAGGQLPGTYTGMVRVADPNNRNDRSEYELLLGPDLAPQSAVFEAITYLPFEVEVLDGNQAPTANVIISPPSVQVDDPLLFYLTAELDAEGDAILYDIDFNYTGSFVPDQSSLDPGTAPPPDVLLWTAPGVTPTAGSFVARVKVYDFDNPAGIFYDIPYTVIDVPCTPQSISFDFNDGPQGWRSGASWGTGNFDRNSWGAFRHGCESTPAVLDAIAASGGALSGACLLSSPDPDTCANVEDYGGSASHNIIGPPLTVPQICTPDDIRVSFNLLMRARPGAEARLYATKDHFVGWGPPIWTLAATGSDQVLTNQEVTIPGFAAGDQLLLRFIFTDFEPTSHTSTTTYAGLFVDDVTITTDATTPWALRPSQYLYEWTFEEGSAGWTVGGLPSTDLQTACPGGQWGGFASCLMLNQYEGGVQSHGLVAGPDGGICGGFQGDMGALGEYNIVSPPMDFSALFADPIIAFHQLTSVSHGGFTLDVYVSTDGGMSWGAPFFGDVAVAPVATDTFYRNLPLPGVAGQPNCRLRFQVQTLPPVSGPPPGTPNFCDGSNLDDATVGEIDGVAVIYDPIAIDNVRIN